MASQPLNSLIQVHRPVRSQRDLPLHRSTWEASIGVGVNPQVMVQPGEEIAVTETRGSTGIPFVTTSLTEGRATGLAVVRYAKASPTFSDAVTNLTGIEIFRIGQDAFITKTAANVSDDLHAEVRDLA